MRIFTTSFGTRNKNRLSRHRRWADGHPPAWVRTESIRWVFTKTILVTYRFIHTLLHKLYNPEMNSLIEFSMTLIIRKNVNCHFWCKMPSVCRYVSVPWLPIPRLYSNYMQGGVQWRIRSPQTLPVIHQKSPKVTLFKALPMSTQQTYTPTRRILRLKTPTLTKAHKAESISNVGLQTSNTHHCFPQGLIPKERLREWTQSMKGHMLNLVLCCTKMEHRGIQLKELEEIFSVFPTYITVNLFWYRNTRPYQINHGPLP